METRKITLTEGLAELKLLNKKIEKKLNELNHSSLIDYSIGNSTSKNLEISGLDVDTFTKEAQSALDSLNQLIRNKNTLKSTIARTNAVTEVTISGKTYTIVEAIERKNTLETEKTLLTILNNQYSSTNDKVQYQNRRAEEEADRIIESKVSNENKNSSPDDIKKLRDFIISDKKAKLVDPLKLKEKIEKLSENIDEFERNVDVALSIVNAKTYIEIES
jgi:hypothetical protein